MRVWNNDNNSIKLADEERYVGVDARGVCTSTDHQSHDEHFTKQTHSAYVYQKYFSEEGDAHGLPWTLKEPRMIKELNEGRC